MCSPPGRRAGTCADLAVTFCRTLNIPARYVFGYLPDIDVPVGPEPMDFCAWMEVFLDGAWWTFDPATTDHGWATPSSLGVTNRSTWR